jgi:intracellular septation protein
MSKPAPPWLKPFTDYGPIAAFMAGYFTGDLMTATVWLMVATAIAVILGLVMERRVPWMPLTTAIIVGVFGGLTLWLNDETFIKMKPTIIQLIFAGVLLGGLAFGKSFLKPMLQSAWTLSDAAWRTLTFRFGLFFIGTAALNEVVWRTQSTDFWVTFKVFGLMGLTMLFFLAQTPFILRQNKAGDA